jgi:hypothetical protein
MSQFSISSEEVISTLIAFMVIVLVCYRLQEHDLTDDGYSQTTFNAFLLTIYLASLSVSILLLRP